MGNLNFFNRVLLLTLALYAVPSSQRYPQKLLISTYRMHCIEYTLRHRPKAFTLAGTCRQSYWRSLA